MNSFILSSSGIAVVFKIFSSSHKFEIHVTETSWFIYNELKDFDNVI